MTIMQGDSYPIYIALTQDGDVLTPDLIAELEVCVGDKLRYLYTAGNVYFDRDENQWFIHPTQVETLSMDVGAYLIAVRIRYKTAGMEEVVGVNVGRIQVKDSISEAVI